MATVLRFYNNSIQLYFILLLLLFCNRKISNRIIRLLFVFPTKGNRGPSSLAKSYVATIDILSKNKKISKYIKFIVVSKVSLESYKKYVENPNNIIWFLYADYFTTLNSNVTINFMNTIYGPTVSPLNWYKFPVKNTYEVYWSKSINKLLGYIVQSERVKNHLINHSEKIKDIEKKYIVSNGCILPNYTCHISSWNDRFYDVMVYAKFADIKKENELKLLLKMLEAKYKVLLIRYGNHTQESLLHYSNNCKIVIYFSFYDCWPSSLMEIVSRGAYPVVQQCEFIGIYGTCINHFENHIYEVINATDEAMKMKYNPKKISFFYNDKNNCMRIFQLTLQEIYNRKTRLKIHL